MNFRDTLVACAQCGKQFVFKVEKQRLLAEQGQKAATPDLCESCTQKIRYGGKLRGRIKWFSLEKGYGFLVQENASELFVHRSSVSLSKDGTIPALEEGQEVLYEVADTPKGPQAAEVTPYSAQEG